MGDRSVAAVPAAVRVRVPAKINLYLAAGPPRSDGYHPLTTVFQALSLSDTVTAEPADRLRVRVGGAESAAVPLGADNLAARAATLLARSARVRAQVALTLDKGIPVAGGLAGGSGDAAGALVACSQLWSLEPDPDRLHRLAARLGSDVPFALHGRTALGTGRGERLSPVMVRGTYSWVLGFDAEGLSTPAVYAELDRLRSERAVAPAPGPDALLAALRAGDPGALGAALHNDLTEPAIRLRPRLARTLAAGSELGALGALICGSGPTCAFLARDSRHADELAAGLAAAGVVRSAHRADGPVAGAHRLA